MKDPQFLETVYLRILSRYPTEDEKKAFANFKIDGKNGGWFRRLDTIWALINSEEFINRH